MNNIKKIALTILLLIAAGLSVGNIDVSTTEAGLQYLAVVYSAGLILILGGLFYLLTRTTNKLKYSTLIFWVVGLLSFIPTLGDLQLYSRIFIIVINGLGILAFLLSIMLTWKVKEEMA